MSDEEKFTNYWNINCTNADSCCYFNAKKVFNYFTNTERMLQMLKDRGVIRSWYYNGSYHVGNELP